MYRIAVCDDQITTCKEIETILSTCSFGRTLDIELFETGEHLCEVVQLGTHFDLFILDIELKTTTGVKVACMLREVLNQSTAHIIFISGKPEYAMELFDCRPLNFLIKPLVLSKVLECVANAMKLDAELASSFFEYRTKKTSNFVPYKNIRYFASENRTVIIRTVSGIEQFTGQLQQVLLSSPPPPFNFVQIHQSFVVNLEFVTKQLYTMVVLDDGERLNISHTFRNAVRDRTLQIRTALRGI